MSINLMGGRIKPTKGFLLELKKRLQFVIGGCELLTLKRDHLSKELREDIEQLEALRESLGKRLQNAYRDLLAAQMSLGPAELDAQSASTQGTLDVEVLPRSIMGVLVPFVKIRNRPNLKDRLGAIEYSVAKKFQELLEDLLKVAELEASIERVADELGKTNRKVNALEKIVIPGYKQGIKMIEDRLDEDMLEEFIRTKLIRT
ncbi:MAG: V-type ATP synthase subunit D, partial [Candidatus Bathyarchaeia archaeon]